MPLTEKGHKIMRAMVEEYGEEKGKQVFYASKNAGKITGVDSDEEAKPKVFIHARKAKDMNLSEMPSSSNISVTGTGAAQGMMGPSSGGSSGSATPGGSSGEAMGSSEEPETGVGLGGWTGKH